MTDRRAAMRAVRPTVVFAALFAAALACAGCSEAATYSSKALIENARLLDGKKVTYRGEAVTAAMKRGEHAWLNVNDSDNAIGVWCGGRMLEPVRFLGSYKCKGDTVEVEGIFNRACNEHGGELDIHAARLNVIRGGFEVTERFEIWKTALAAFLFLSTLAILAMFRKRI